MNTKHTLIVVAVFAFGAVLLYQQRTLRMRDDPMAHRTRLDDGHETGIVRL